MVDNDARFNIRTYQPGDEQGILQLFNAVFAEDDPDHRPRTEAEWRWQYTDNPQGMYVTVAEEVATGRIIAHYSCVPYKAMVEGRVHQGVQIVDSMVAQDYRRGLKSQGLFLQTVQACYDAYGDPADIPFGYGFPNKKAYRIGVRMLGYQPVHTPVVATARNLFAHADDDALAQGELAAGEVVEVTEADAGFDALWARLEGSVSFGLARDARYLNWRYRDCPLAEYRTFALRQGSELVGACVVRHDWTGPPILGVMEFLVAEHDAPVANRLAQHLVAHARQHNQQRVELWCSPNYWLFAHLEGRGFFHEETPFNLVIKLLDESIDLGYVRRDWYFSMGDSDVF